VFSDRLKERNKVWWGPPSQLWKPKRLVDAIVRRRQRTTLLRHSDPDRRWHAGRHWQRRLNNKWNSREFAKKHGFPVPELYWMGGDPTKIPFDELPANYVIRTCWGASALGVFTMVSGHELLREKRLGREDLVKAVAEYQAKDIRFPVMVEEFVGDSAGEGSLPVEYEFHSFNGEIAGILAMHREHGLNGKEFFIEFYRPDWQPHDIPIHHWKKAVQGNFSRPKQLSEMLHCAEVLGRAYRNYVRVDLLSHGEGFVFGEFSSVPDQGKKFTLEVDRLFEEYWKKYCPGLL
jgi:hypothetical protein